MQSGALRFLSAVVFVPAVTLAGSVAGAADDSGTPVSRLVRLLKARDANTRLHAADALGDLGSKAKTAVPALAKALDDKHAVVRMYAVRSLGRIGQRPSTAVLAGMLQVRSGNKHVASAFRALIALQAMAEEENGNIQKAQRLAADLKSKTVETRVRAAVGLGALAPPNADFRSHSKRTTVWRIAMSSLLDAMNDQDATVRKAAVVAAGKWGRQAGVLAVLRLRGLSEFDPSADVRHAAGRTLGMVGPEHVSQKRTIVQRERFGPLDMILLRGLVRLKKNTPGARRLYARALLSGQPKAVQLARQSLDFAKTPTDFIAADWLLKLETGDRGELLVTLAVIANARNDGLQVASTVSRMLISKDEDVAEAAHRALARLRPKWSQVSPVYWRMLDSGDDKLVLRAIYSLARQPRLHSDVAKSIQKQMATVSNAKGRERWLRVLRQIAPRDEDAVGLFVKLATTDPHKGVRDEALYALLLAGGAARAHRKTLLTALEQENDPLLAVRIIGLLESFDRAPGKKEKLTKAQQDYREILRKLKVRYTAAAALKQLKQIIAAQEKLQKATERHNLESVLGKLRERED